MNIQLIQHSTKNSVWKCCDERKASVRIFNCWCEGKGHVRRILFTRVPLSRWGGVVSTVTAKSDGNWISSEKMLILRWASVLLTKMFWMSSADPWLHSTALTLSSNVSESICSGSCCTKKSWARTRWIIRLARNFYTPAHAPATHHENNNNKKFLVK